MNEIIPAIDLFDKGKAIRKQTEDALDAACIEKIMAAFHKHLLNVSDTDHPIGKYDTCSISASELNVPSYVIERCIRYEVPRRINSRYKELGYKTSNVYRTHLGVYIDYKPRLLYKLKNKLFGSHHD